MRIGVSRGRSERGATLIIVAAFVVVAALMLAFVIDIGNQRQNRRQLTTATDSAALAVASEWAASGADPMFDCETSTTVDDDLAVANNPVGNPDPSYQCIFSDVVPYRSGVVTVASSEVVDYSFGGVTGVNESSTSSLTSVRVQPAVGGGLRPVAICTGDFSRTGWDTSTPGVEVAPTGSTTTVTLESTQGNSDDVCESSGNWNQVIFRANNACPGEENASGGGATFRDQYTNGSPYDVAVNECLSRLPGNGGFASGNPEAIEGMKVFFPVFESAEGGGAGIYLVKGFLEALIIDVFHHGNTTEIEFQPIRYQTQGTCCLLNEFNQQIDLCDVGTTTGGADPNAATNCKPRDLSSNPVQPEIPDEECTADRITYRHNPSYHTGQERLQQDFDVTVDISNAGDCGALTLVLEAPTPPPKDFTTGFAGGELTGFILKDDAIWEPGPYTVLILNDGNEIGRDSFTL